jgi:hypothetical protein
VWLLPFLLLTVFVEVGARNLVKGNNQWVFNLYLPVQYFFFSYLFLKAIVNPAFKRIIYIVSVLFVAFALFNLFAIQGLKLLNHHTLICSSFLITIYACYYFYEISDPEDETDVLRLPMWWIAASCLLFFSGCILYFSAWDTLVNHRKDINGLLYKEIILIINILHYSLLAIGILFIGIRQKI